MIIKATVIKGVGGLYSVRLDNEYHGTRTVNVRGRGTFRHDKTVLLIGDRVEIEPVENGEFFCKTILERKNSLIRPPLANLDVLFLVISCRMPEPTLEIVDKMISIAEYNSAEPVIIITKSDLDGTQTENIYEIYKKCGFDIFTVSSETGEGVDEIYKFIKKISFENNPICAFCGASGAGKSTLINRLFPSLHLQTGVLSERTQRGKNTTRHVELFPLEEILSPGTNGYLADTPGFSFVDFERFDFFSLADLADTFREFSSSFGKCKYTKCTHTKEDGCDIIKRVKEGVIPKCRHDSYIAMYDILKNKPTWKK